ncbi:MAG: hypothetical protein H6555_08910 [Lewinellaceae bacterium]|nr:hypothetical protein [Lewinellaceae bacterium]
MKTAQNISRIFLSFALVFMAMTLFAQQANIQFFRPWDQKGINVFEPSKNDNTAYDGLSVRVGGSFTQQYQALKHENNASPAVALYPLGKGFNLATANLNFDFQIEDGIRVCLENYMSSRHHPEFWVKGGYIQIDKLPMFGNPDWFTNNFRVKIGHFQPNYGDQQFRRTDNGNAIYNPFVGNYILDAFTTEIGSEVYAFPTDNLMFMVGMTAGLINGNVQDYSGTTTKKNPSIYLKGAFDKQINDDVRVRLSASLYSNSGSVRNTLYAGDRTGSRYYLPLEAANASASANFTSGRINPGLTNEVSAIQINPFVKVSGFELFATYEMSSGKTNAESEKRDWNQLAVDAVYRFLPNEQMFIGARYNTVSGRLQGFADDITINRTAFSAGWFPSKNMLLKAEIVNQNYNDFPAADIRREGKFNGLVIEAVIGF